MRGFPSSLPDSRSVKCDDQLRQFGDERLLGQPHRLVEAGLHPLALLLVQLGIELLKIARGSTLGKSNSMANKPGKRRGVVARVVEAAQPLPGRGLQLAVAAVEGLHGLGKLLLELPHLGREVVDAVLADEPDARLGIGQAQRLPVGDHLAAHGGDGFEGRVGDVQQFLAGGEELRFGVERLGGLGLLLDRQRLPRAEPADGNPNGRHRPAQRCAEDVAVRVVDS